MRPPDAGASKPVAVDAMGGDRAPGVVVEGTLLAAARGVPVVLVGDTQRVERALAGRACPVVHASATIGMDEHALAAVRSKPDSSIGVALGEVAAGRASAMVSCGHSGAVTVEAVRTLQRHEAAGRVAMAVSLPRLDGGRLIVVDVGANVDCKAEHLCDFAELGSAWARSLGTTDPRIGVLSNGEEASKGNKLVRHSVQALQARGLAPVGQIEPGAAFAGHCDVLVCDGFVGNVALKSMESAIQLFGHLRKSDVGDFVYGGALLLGVRGVVVIGHGDASAPDVCAAIELAHRSAERDVTAHVGAHLGG